MPTIDLYASGLHPATEDFVDAVSSFFFLEAKQPWAADVEATLEPTVMTTLHLAWIDPLPELAREAVRARNSKAIAAPGTGAPVVTFRKKQQTSYELTGGDAVRPFQLLRPLIDCSIPRIAQKARVVGKLLLARRDIEPRPRCVRPWVELAVISRSPQVTHDVMHYLSALSPYSWEKQGVSVNKVLGALMTLGCHPPEVMVWFDEVCAVHNTPELYDQIIIEAAEKRNAAIAANASAYREVHRAGDSVAAAIEASVPPAQPAGATDTLMTPTAHQLAAAGLEHASATAASGSGQKQALLQAHGSTNAPSGVSSSFAATRRRERLAAGHQVPATLDGLVLTVETETDTARFRAALKALAHQLTHSEKARARLRTSEPFARRTASAVVERARVLDVAHHSELLAHSFAVLLLVTAAAPDVVACSRGAVSLPFQVLAKNSRKWGLTETGKAAADACGGYALTGPCIGFLVALAETAAQTQGVSATKRSNRRVALLESADASSLKILAQCIRFPSSTQAHPLRPQEHRRTNALVLRVLNWAHESGVERSAQSDAALFAALTRLRFASDEMAAVLDDAGMSAADLDALTSAAESGRSKPRGGAGFVSKNLAAAEERRRTHGDTAVVGNDFGVQAGLHCAIGGGAQQPQQQQPSPPLPPSAFANPPAAIVSCLAGAASHAADNAAAVFPGDSAAASSTAMPRHASSESSTELARSKPFGIETRQQQLRRWAFERRPKHWLRVGASAYANNAPRHLGAAASAAMALVRPE